jgi:hypothetical protein
MQENLEQHSLIKQNFSLSALSHAANERLLSRHENIYLKRFTIALMAVGLYCMGALAVAQTGYPQDPRDIQAKQAWTSASAELRVAEARLKQDPNNTQSQHALAVILDEMGDIQNLQGQKDASHYPYDAGYERALLLARNDVKMNPRSPLMETVKRIKVTTRRDDEARAWEFRNAARSYYRAAHVIHQRLAALDPNNDEWQRALALSYSKIGPGLVGAKNRLAPYQSALDIHLRLAQRNPVNADWQRDLATIYGKIGDATVSKQAKVPAEYHEELAIRTKLFRKDETNTLWTRELAMTFDKIGNSLNYLAKLDAARDAYTDGQGLHEDLSKLDPSNTQWKNDLATVYVEIADLENRRRSKFQGQALATYQNALKIRTQLLELDPSNIQWQVNLVESHRKIARFYGDGADYARMLEVNQAAQQQMARFAQRYPQDRGWLFYQLEFYFDIGFEHLRVQRDTRPRIASDKARFPPDPERFEAANLAGEATFKKMVEIIDVLARQDDANAQQ